MLRPFCRREPRGAECGKCGKHWGKETAKGKLDVGGIGTETARRTFLSMPSNFVTSH